MQKRKPGRPHKGWRSAARESKARRDGSKYICKCECGGQVRGVEGFGRLWTWCEKCSPVQVIHVTS